MDPRRFGLSDQDLEALGYRVKPKGASTMGTPSPKETPWGTDLPSSEGSTEAPDRAPGASGDPGRRRWVWTVVLLAALAWTSSSYRHLPDPVSANRPDTVFSSARAMAQLVEIAQAPRPTGSPEHDRVMRYLVDRLTYLGLDPEVQTATVVRRADGSAVAATVRNVVARLPGSAPTGAVGLAAHYDGVPLSHAAADDGVGVVAILETLRAVTAGAPLRNDLVVVLTDASELGALGARAFAEGHPWMADLDVVVAAEMRGVSGPAFLVERNERGGPILAAARADEPILASSLARELPGLAGVAPDARVLREEGGVRAATLVALGGLEAHHRVGDLAARVSERTLQHEGAQLLALTRSLGAADLGDASVREAPVPAYLSLPWIGVVPHPASWTLPMTLAILAGWGAALFLLRAAGRPLRAVLAGSAFGLAIVALGAGAGWALLAGVRALHPEYGALASAVYEDGVHALALVLTVVALVAAAYALARPRLGSREIFLGALAVPMALAAGLTLRAPHAAASVQPAAALAVVAALAVAMVPPARRRGGWAWAGFLALSGAMLVVLVPALELLAAALTLRGAPLLGGAVAACLLLFLPLLDWLIAPRWWWTPALAGAAAAALVLTAVPMVRPAAHPVRTSLAYLAEGAAGGADVGSAPLAAPAVPFTAAPATAALAAPAGDVLAAPRRARRVVGQWLTVPGPGEEWARSWVGVPATGPTDPGAIFLPGGAWEVAGSGPPAEIALPEVAVVEERLDGAMRRVQLALRPGLDAEMVAIRIPDDAPGELTALGDREWGGGDPPVRALEHWGRPADGALGVGVALDASAPELVLEVIEHHLRPREVLGPSYFERSRDLVPDATTGSDRVIQRTRVRLPLDGAPARMAGGPS